MIPFRLARASRPRSRICRQKPISIVIDQQYPFHLRVDDTDSKNWIRFVYDLR
jgi:hypothetical protein